MTAYLAGDRAIGTTISPDVYRVTAFLREARERAGWTNHQVDNLFGTNGMAGHWTTSGSQPAVPSVRQWEVLKQHLGFGGELDGLVAELGASERPDGWGAGDGREHGILAGHDRAMGATQSWGTALKPALEPITVARKPPAGTVTNNVRAHGTGALNLDGCRIGADGRWPANLIHDGNEEVLALLGDAARFFYCAKASKRDRDEGLEGFQKSRTAGSGALRDGNRDTEARANIHPTVKPTDLMAYLVRLVTPPGGLVLDPFMGSGSTGKAAMREGFNFIGCELSPEYLAIAEARIAHELAKRQRPEPPQSDLFAA
jgi:site-specific DNA-methyltransferase (adenine-specific)